VIVAKTEAFSLSTFLLNFFYGEITFVGDRILVFLQFFKGDLLYFWGLLDLDFAFATLNFLVGFVFTLCDEDESIWVFWLDS